MWKTVGAPFAKVKPVGAAKTMARLSNPMKRHMRASSCFYVEAAGNLSIALDQSRVAPRKGKRVARAQQHDMRTQNDDSTAGVPVLAAVSAGFVSVDNDGD